jgi:hypothetical protein
MQPGSLPELGSDSYTTMSLAVHVSAAGVAGAAASNPDGSECATCDDIGIMRNASSAGASAGTQVGMVASSRLMRFPCLMS